MVSVKDKLPEFMHDLTLRELESVSEFVRDNIRMNGTLELNALSVRFVPFADKLFMIDAYDKHPSFNKFVEYEMIGFYCEKCNMQFEDNHLDVIKHAISNVRDKYCG